MSITPAMIEIGRLRALLEESERENVQLHTRIAELESALAYEEKFAMDHRRDEAREDPKQQRLIPVKEEAID